MAAPFLATFPVEGLGVHQVKSRNLNVAMIIGVFNVCHIYLCIVGISFGLGILGFSLIHVIIQ